MILAADPTVTVAGITTAGLIVVALIGVLVQQRSTASRIAEVHVLVNDRLDKVLKANQNLTEMNRGLVELVGDLHALVVADPAAVLSPQLERSLGQVQAPVPLADTLQSQHLDKDS